MVNIVSIAVVAVRIIGIYLILAITNSTHLIFLLIARPNTEMPGGQVLTIVQVAIPFGIAILAIVFSKSIGRLVTRGIENTTLELDRSNLSILQEVAFSVLGLSVLVYSIPSLFRLIAFFAYGSNVASDSEFSATPPIVLIGYLVEAGVQVGLGIWLTLGSKGIAAWIKKRILAESPPEEPSDHDSNNV